MNSIPAKLAIAILVKLTSDPEVIGRLLEELGAMPNIPTPTMGGESQMLKASEALMEQEKPDRSDYVN